MLDNHNLGRLPGDGQQVPGLPEGEAASCGSTGTCHAAGGPHIDGGEEHQGVPSWAWLASHCTAGDLPITRNRDLGLRLQVVAA